MSRYPDLGDLSEAAVNARCAARLAQDIWRLICLYGVGDDEPAIVKLTEAMDAAEAEAVAFGLVVEYPTYGETDSVFTSNDRAEAKR